jgi:CBS domain-containing protein
MNSDPTRATLARPPAIVEVTPTTSVADAQRALAASRALAAVVLRDHRPVGVVSAAALRDSAAAHRPDADVADVMDYEVVRLTPTAGERSTLQAFTEAAWKSLLRRRPHGANTDVPPDVPPAGEPQPSLG